MARSEIVKCHCGKTAVRATVMYRVMKRGKKAHSVIHTPVCEAHFKLYHLGLETYTCPKCKRSFFVDLDTVYGDEEAFAKGLSCPFCYSKIKVNE